MTMAQSGLHQIDSHVANALIKTINYLKQTKYGGLDTTLAAQVSDDALNPFILRNFINRDRAFPDAIHGINRAVEFLSQYGNEQLSAHLSDEKKDSTIEKLTNRIVQALAEQSIYRSRHFGDFYLSSLGSDENINSFSLLTFNSDQAVGRLYASRADNGFHVSAFQQECLKDSNAMGATREHFEFLLFERDSFKPEAWLRNPLDRPTAIGLKVLNSMLIELGINANAAAGVLNKFLEQHNSNKH